MRLKLKRLAVAALLSVVHRPSHLRRTRSTSCSRSIQAASNTFWQAVQKGYDDACGKIGATCQMVYVQTDGSIQEQVANMEAALARSPDALITSIVDNNAFDDVIQRAREAGRGRDRRRTSTIWKALRAMPGRPSSARASCRPAIRWRRRSRTNFPKEGPIKVLVGVSGPGQNWSEQRALGVTNFLDEMIAANPDREITYEKIDSGLDLASSADRVGAYLAANPDTNAYFDTGFWHAGVARVLADRGIPPGTGSAGRLRPRAGSAGADEGRLHPGAGRPAALHAGLHAGDGGLPRQDGRPGPGRHRHRDRASCGPIRWMRSWSFPSAGHALKRSLAAPAREKVRRATPERSAVPCVVFSRLALQKPELAASLLLLLLVLMFQIRSEGFFLGYANLRGMLGFLPEMALVAVGVTLLMICGEFDLSVGSVFALTPMTHGRPDDDGLGLLARVGSRPARCRADRVSQRLADHPVRHSVVHHDARDVVHGTLADSRDLGRVSAPAGSWMRFRNSCSSAYVGPGELLRASFLWFVAIAILVGLLLAKTNFGNWVRATGGFLPAAKAMGIPD